MTTPLSDQRKSELHNEAVRVRDSYSNNVRLRSIPVAASAIIALLDELAAIARERDELRAVVEKLRKSEDGVPITDGMVLWGVYTGHENDQFREGSGTVKSWKFEPRYSQWAKYSTRVAAEAAKGGESL